jgi:small subunit ribosomal protein S1
MKQCKPNPWHRFSEEYPVGSKVSGTIKNIATFGIFMTVGDDEEHKIDVLIPANEIDSDLTPEEALKKYNKGDKVTGVVLAIVQERERVTVSLRRGNDDALTELAQKLIEEGITTCVVSAIKKDGIEVKVNDQFGAFIKRGDLSRDKGEQRPERFAIGDKIDSKVLGFDKNTGKLLLSIRALEIEKEKRAIEEYGSVASGASLSDILGGALKKENSNNS